MTNLLNDLNKMCGKIETKRRGVIEEITNKFKDYIDSQDFEDYIKRCVSRQSDAEKAKRTCCGYIKFWQHSSGCSDTHFSAFGFSIYQNQDKNGYGYCYNGVDMLSIQNEILKPITTYIISRLEELGFKNIYIEHKECWLNYYDKEIHYSW